MVAIRLDGTSLAWVRVVVVADERVRSIRAPEVVVENSRAAALNSDHRIRETMQGPESEVKRFLCTILTAFLTLPQPPSPTPNLRPPFSNTSSPRDLEPSQDDIEKVNKWQQERIERRLRGEYESAAKNLGQLVCAV